MKNLIPYLVLSVTLVSATNAFAGEEECAGFTITPHCPINRCYPDYYQAMATYAGAVSCQEAIQVIGACGHANTGTRPAVAAATSSCDADKSVSVAIKRQAKVLERKCLEENKDEGGTLGAYIRTACKLSAYASLLPASK